MTCILDAKNKSQNTAKKAQEDVIILDQDSMDNGSLELHDWNEMRKFDDDHDEDWFSSKEKKLGKY